MLIKKQFNPLTVARYMRVDLALAILFSGAVWAMYSTGNETLPGIPFSIPATLGSALAIFIAFRNQSSYARWWEARTAWGTISASSRVLARLAVTLSNAHRGKSNFRDDHTKAFQSAMVRLQVAWCYALAFQLRRHDRWEELRPLLAAADYDRMMRSSNRPVTLQLIQGEQIYEAMESGVLVGFDSVQVEGPLNALALAQGTCERIRDTPLLRQYHYFTRMFLVVFMMAIPLGIAAYFNHLHLGWAIVPVSVLVSFVFAVMARVGEVNEDPFKGTITDIPLNALCRSIERDMLETLGENQLPPLAEPARGILD